MIVMVLVKKEEDERALADTRVGNRQAQQSQAHAPAVAVTGNLPGTLFLFDPPL